MIRFISKETLVLSRRPHWQMGLEVGDVPMAGVLSALSGDLDR